LHPLPRLTFDALVLRYDARLEPSLVATEVSAQDRAETAQPARRVPGFFPAQRSGQRRIQDGLRSTPPRFPPAGHAAAAQVAAQRERRHRRVLERQLLAILPGARGRLIP